MDKNEARRLLTPEELSFFCGQIALMLESGIALYDSMELLAGNYQHTRYALSFQTLNERMVQSGALNDAMRLSGMFPDYAVKMTAIGERTGRLDKIMRNLSAYYAREGELRNSLRGAVYYPLSLMIIMAVVVVILNARVLPLFEQVLKNLGSEVTSATQLAMSVGRGLGIGVLALILIVLIGALACFILVKLGKRQALSRLGSRVLPPFRRLENKIVAGRFCHVLAITLSAGYPSGEAIGLCADMLKDARDIGRIREIARRVEQDGEEISSAIEEARLLDPLKTRMLRIGFMAGQADTVVGNLAEMYEKETDDSLYSLLSRVEPTLVSVLAVVIGCILLTVMLPLAGIMSSFL